MKKVNIVVNYVFGLNDVNFFNFSKVVENLKFKVVLIVKLIFDLMSRIDLIEDK